MVRVGRNVLRRVIGYLARLTSSCIFLSMAFEICRAAQPHDPGLRGLCVEMKGIQGIGNVPVSSSRLNNYLCFLTFTQGGQLRSEVPK